MSDAAPGGPHVLVVEDDLNSAEALRFLYAETGHRATVAHSVADAVALASADPPDLVLLDLTLPDGDGLEVLEALRRADTWAGTVVALTGHDEPAVRRECLARGCREVLVKPVSIRELLRKTPGWLAGSG